MADISSPTNSRVKQIKKLLADRRYRKKENAFVIEGTRWMDEIYRSKTELLFWLATEQWLEENAELASQLEQQTGRPLTIEPTILKNIADTDNPSGVLAVTPIPSLSWPQEPNLLLLLDQIRDPGNLGTLIRSALAAGAQGIVLGNGCVDPFNPKVVRSSMGALLRLPIQQTSWDASGELWQPCKVHLADAAGDVAYSQVDWNRPSAIMIGGEANGASQEARSVCDSLISIPMAQASESLNAGVAGSVILFEALRQRSETS